MGNSTSNPVNAAMRVFEPFKNPNELIEALKTAESPPGHYFKYYDAFELSRSNDRGDYIFSATNGKGSNALFKATQVLSPTNEFQLEIFNNIVSKTINVQNQDDDGNPKNNTKEAALMWAAVNKKTEFVKSLIEDNDLDLNTLYNYNKVGVDGTILHIVVSQDDENLDVIKALMDGGIDYNIKNEENETAFVYALELYGYNSKSAATIRKGERRNGMKTHLPTYGVKLKI